MMGLGAHGRSSAGPAYDYVLAAGPGRSGITFLYRALNAHPGFSAPEIKEAHYCRSARRLERTLGDLRGSGAMLLDVADTAWSDPRLAAVAALVRGGRRILVVVLMRRHRDWAPSTMPPGPNSGHAGRCHPHTSARRRAPIEAPHRLVSSGSSYSPSDTRR